MTTASDELRPRLRPLSLGEILDVAIKICISHWRTLIAAVLLVVVPLQILDSLVNADYTTSSFDPDRADDSFDDLNGYLGGIAISAGLQGLAVLLAMATCFRAIAQAYLGEATDWRSSLSYALRNAPSLLWLTLLYGVGLVLAILLFILPGFWLYIAWAFAMPALLIEGRRGSKALGRSFELVRGRWWRTFGVVAVGFILGGIVSFLVQAVFLVGLVVNSDNGLLVLVLSTLAGIVGLAISTPFQAALLTVVYFDLRVRKEGFDLELLAQEIGGTVPAGGGAVSPAASVAAAQPEPDRRGAPYWPPPQDWEPDAGEPPAGDCEPVPQQPPDPPFWPPPPGWKPVTRNGDGDGAAEDDEPPRLPGVPYG